MISREIAILFFVTFFAGMSVSLMAPILPQIRDEFSLSYAAVSVVLAVFGMARLAMALPAGYFYHKVSSKILLLSGIAAIFFGSLLAFFSRSFAEFIMSQIIIGAGFSFCVTTIIISLSLAAGKGNRGTILGINSMARSSSAIAAPVLAGIISSMLLWRFVFGFYILMAIAAFAMSWAFVRPKAADKRGKEKGGNGFYSKPALLSVLFTGFLASFSTAGFRATVVPLFASDVIKLDASAIGMVFGISAVLHFVTAPAAAVLSDRYGRKRFLLFGLAAQLAGLVYFLFSRSLSDLVISMAFLGAGTMIFVLPPAIVGDISPAKNMGRNQSLLRFAIDSGFFAGPLALGLILDVYGFSFTAFATIAMTLISIALTLCFVRERERKISWKKFIGLEED